MAQIASQLLQFPQKYQVQGKSYPCDSFCIASVKLISVTYLGYLAKKYETEQTCKQTVKQLPH